MSVGRWARVRSARGSTLTVACYGGAAVGLAALVFVLLDQPTGRDVLLVALGLVLVLGAIEFLGQQPESPTHGVTTPG